MYPSTTAFHTRTCSRHFPPRDGPPMLRTAIKPPDHAPKAPGRPCAIAVSTSATASSTCHHPAGRVSCWWKRQGTRHKIPVRTPSPREGSRLSSTGSVQSASGGIMPSAPLGIILNTLARTEEEELRNTRKARKPGTQKPANADGMFTALPPGPTRSR